MQLKNEWFEVLELVALFLLKTGTFCAKNWKEISVDAIFCFFFLDLFRKEEGKYTVTLINGSSLISQRIQNKVVLVVLQMKCRLRTDCGLLFSGLGNKGTIVVTFLFASVKTVLRSLRF